MKDNTTNILIKCTWDFETHLWFALIFLRKQWVSIIIFIITCIMSMSEASSPLLLVQRHQTTFCLFGYVTYTHAYTYTWISLWVLVFVCRANGLIKSVQIVMNSEGRQRHNTIYVYIHVLVHYYCCWLLMMAFGNNAAKNCAHSKLFDRLISSIIVDTFRNIYFFCACIPWAFHRCMHICIFNFLAEGRILHIWLYLSANKPYGIKSIYILTHKSRMLISSLLQLNTGSLLVWWLSDLLAHSYFFSLLLASLLAFRAYVSRVEQRCVAAAARAHNYQGRAFKYSRQRDRHKKKL